MPNRRIHAAAAVLGIIAACGLVSARGTFGTETTLVAVRSGDEATVVIHLTGLVLVVPPARDGGRTDVLLPTIAEHAALLGFGVAGDEPFVPRLCRSDAGHDQAALQAGICYVDLDRWRLEPFGAGGEPTPAEGTLPPGVLNTTRASGGEYGVHVPALAGELRAQVPFAAGRAGGQCSLASWIYEPAGARGNPERLPLVNVLDWEIRNPTTRTLVFRSRSSDETLTVPLPAPDAGGKIELILAHIPREELDDLPPARPHSASMASDTAHHVDAFYNLLRDRGTRAQPLPGNSPNRRLPHSPTVLRPSGCEVGITVPVGGAGADFPAFASTLALTGDLRSVGLTAPRHLPGRPVSTTARAGIRTQSCITGSGDRS